MVGSGVGAKNGILFKTAVSLEEAGRAQIVALDKTGTITEGRLSVEELALGDATTFNSLNEAPTWFTPEFILQMDLNTEIFATHLKSFSLTMPLLFLNLKHLSRLDLASVADSSDFFIWR